MIDMKILKRTHAYRDLWKSTHENIQFDSEKFLEKLMKTVYLLES